MAATDITIPADQAEGTTSVVATWFKQVGDAVKVHEPLLELSTDKVTVEIAAPVDGVLTEILKGEGEAVAPGEVVGRIGEKGTGNGERGEGVADNSDQTEKADRADKADKADKADRADKAGGADGTDKADRTDRADTGDGGRPPLSPAVRRLLKEHGLEASQVEGTGKGGRITAEDVERVVAGGADRADKTDKADGRTGEQADSPGAEASPPPASPVSLPTSRSTTGLPSRLVPHSLMRKSIAAHMVHSVATAPHVTTVFDADLSRVVRHRELYRAEAEARGFKLTYTAYFVQATARALQAVPEVNSRWHDEALELFDDCNIGIGTALEDGGLIVPVIPQAQSLDLLQTAERLHDLTARARSGSLTPSDVQGGTFTISNHGVSGSIIATPIIINQPQSAILGIGRMEKRVIVAQSYGHEVTEIRPMLYVTLTIDHRVLDGFQANRFLTEWVRVVEGWGTSEKGEARSEK